MNGRMQPRARGDAARASRPAADAKVFVLRGRVDDALPDLRIQEALRIIEQHPRIIPVGSRPSRASAALDVSAGSTRSRYFATRSPCVKLRHSSISSHMAPHFVADSDASARNSELRVMPPS